MDDKILQNILTECSISTKMVAKTFFPERFSLPFAEEIHDKIFDLIDDPTKNKVAIAAPRGFGKTSIVALALMARYILFKITPFICYINKSHDAAGLQTENLRRELVTNRFIKAMFGDFKARDLDSSDFEEVFSKKAWVAYNTLVWPRGAGQQVRGVLFKNSRPGLFVIDDLEDAKKVDNPDLRADLFQWLYADVIKAVPRTNMDWKIIYIDTLKHEDSVLQKLLDSDDWHSIRLEACDDDFKSVAPNFMSDEMIKKEWEEHVALGQSDVFYRELRNLPISDKDATFKVEDFKYYNIPPDRTPRDQDLKITDIEVQQNSNNETVIIVDPAKTAKMQSADSAIMVIGLDLVGTSLYFRHAISGKFYPDELYDEMFKTAQLYGAKVIGVETTGLEEFIKQPIKNEMMVRGIFYELVWLKARGGEHGEKGKALRIKSHSPYYRSGYIYHNAQAPGIPKLEAQLRMFPRSALWDLMDCAAYIVEMLELGQRYFSPRELVEDIEAEYSELDYEEAINEWRII